MYSRPQGKCFKISSAKDTKNPAERKLIVRAIEWKRKGERESRG